MTFTEDQVEIFNRMFTITTEYTAYKESILTKNGLREAEEYHDHSHNTESASVALPSGSYYKIYFGQSNDASGLAINAFKEFIRLDYSEGLFEKYLKDEGWYLCQ